MKQLVEALRNILPPLVDERFVVDAESIETRERVLVRWLLADQQCDDVEALRMQAAEVRLVSRKYTPHGFISEFELPPHVMRAREDRFELADQALELEGLRFGAGAVLYIRNGMIHSMEGRCWGPEEWPRTEISKRIKV